MKKFFWIIFIFTSFFTLAEDENPNVIHVEDLDRSKIQIRNTNHGIQDFTPPKKDLEKNLDKTLNNLQKLDPASARQVKTNHIPSGKPPAQIAPKNDEHEFMDGDDDGEVTANPKELLEENNAIKKFSAGDSLIGGFVENMKAKVMNSFLKKNPLSHMSHDQVKNFIKERAENSKFGKVLDNHPKLLDIFAGIARDDEALPALMGILENNEKLLTYSYAFMILFVLGIILNIFMFTKANVWKRILFKISLTLAIPCLNFLIFYLMFRKNLDPTLSIVKKYL